MNSKISKILGFATAFVMVAAAAVSLGSSPSASVYAENLTTETMPQFEATEAPATSFTYTVTGDNATITGYSGTVADLKIPSTIDGYTVTDISDYAFNKNSVITSVVIPDTVVSIGYGAFMSCSKLTSVSIPESVVSLENYIFQNCDVLTSIDINTTFISRGMFYDCDGLKNVIIPENITSIGYEAFYSCNSLTSVKVTENVVSIGNSVFSNCNSLTSITYESAFIGRYMFAECDGLKSVTIPECVLSVDDYAFIDCENLTDIKLLNSTIGYRMFGGCDSLASVTIPNNISTVGNEAFINCQSLKTITVEEDVIKLGTGIFQNCDSLTNVNLKNMTISDSMFYDCDGFISVTIPDNILEVGKNAFYDCDGLETVKFENGTASIGEYAFYSCDKLKTLTLPSTLKTINNQAFRYCISLESLTIPKNVSSLGTYVFADCASLKNITFNNTYTYNYMFYNCDGLTSVTVPSNLTTLGQYMFSECDNIKEIDIKTTFISTGMFSGCNSLKTVNIPDNVTLIYANAFKDCSSLTTVTIPSSVTQMGDYVFRNCDTLSNVTLESSVLGEKAFYDCDNIKNVTIPGTIETISNYAFHNCDILSNVTIEEGVKNINTDAFSYCTYLKKIIIPKSVTSINRYAFTDCDYLTIYGYAGSYAETFAAERGFTFVELAAIEITSQPADVSGTAGDTATFTVKASGSNLTYQWQQNTGSGWTAINTTAAKAAFYSVGITAARNGYQYRCVVSDGENTVTSDAATLTYVSTLAITTQPSNYTGKVGDTATFTVAATGATSYQWQQNTGSGWANINTTAGRKASFSIGITAARAKYQYRCVVSDGTTSLTTNAVKMIVDEDLAITTQPANYEGKVGATATFTVAATGATSYQWQQNTGAGWANINTTAGKKASFSIGITAARANYQYRCVVSDGTTSVTSTAVKMIIKEALAITSQPTNFNGTIGDTAKFTVGATGATSYQWQQNTGAGWTNINTSVGRSKTFSIGVTAARANYQYRCLVSDGTNTVISNAVKMVIKEALAITSQPTNFNGAIGDTAKFTVGATGATSYQWQQNTGAGWTNINTSVGRSKTFSIGVTAARANYQYRCLVSDGTNTVISNAVKMVVKASLAITSQPSNYIGAIGSTAKFTVGATGATSYQWYQNTGNGWTAINTTAGRSNTFSVAVAEFRLGYMYRCVVSDGTNTITSDEVQMYIG